VVGFARAVAAPAILAAIPAVGAAALIRELAPPSSLLSVMASSLVVTAVFGAVYWRLGLRPSERTRYAASLRRSMAPAIEVPA
jgi:hypothetical protein